MLTREQAETISLLHAKVARAFAQMMRAQEGSGAFKEAMSRWLVADLDFLASIGDLTSTDEPPPAKAEDGIREIYRTELGVVDGWLKIVCEDNPELAKTLNAFWMRSRVRAALAKEGTPP